MEKDKENESLDESRVVAHAALFDSFFSVIYSMPHNGLSSQSAFITCNDLVSQTPNTDFRTLPNTVIGACGMEDH